MSLKGSWSRGKQVLMFSESRVRANKSQTELGKPKKDQEESSPRRVEY